MLKVLDDIEDNGEFAQMLAEWGKKEETGQIKKGKIVAIKEHGLLIDVGEKSEGFLGLEEVSDENGNLAFNVGDEIDVFVSSGRGERPSVSHKKAIKFTNIDNKIARLGSSFHDTIIEGTIIRKNRGGYVVEAEGVDYFMPRAFAALKDSPKNIGQTIRACIIEVRPADRTIVISRKRFFDIDDVRQTEGAKRLLQEEGKVFEGVVKSVASFGIFVEVDGIRGLVHYTEISYKGPSSATKIYKEGDKVPIKVIGYDEEKKRLSFSIKATMPDPWQDVEKELKKGYTIKVIVSNIENYGAFVDIGNDVEGFLHISEISWDKSIKHPSDVLKVGDEIDVEIIEINPSNRRLRVSLKNLLEKPFTTFLNTHKQYDTITGTVANLTDFGAFINLGKVDGLLHNDDFSWDKSIKCKNALHIGEEITVQIKKIDSTNQRISLSKKDLEPSPAETFGTAHPLNAIVKGKATSIKDFGVFVRVDGIDALIRDEDLYPLKKDEIAIDTEIEAIVAAIDKQHNKVRLSVKRLAYQKQQEELKAINDTEKMTLEDRLKGKI